jgi:Zn-dependent protease
MRWSWRIATVAGIPVRIHATFGLLPLWIFWDDLQRGASVLHAAEGVGLVLTLFFCVVLHEYGHALTARRFGVRTRDITLLPIGGVARLERIPERPAQEVAVALAGPAVTLLIALMLGGILSATGVLARLGSNPAAIQGHFLASLFVFNVGLLLFNLLPAFPMDGGRVLRALLAMRFEYIRATQVAATVGQGFAFFFAVLGLLYNPFLLLVAFFIFMAAGQEAAAVQMRSAFDGIPVARAMIRDFRTLRADEPLSRAVELLLDGNQQDFPVLGTGSGDPPLGVLTRADLLSALAAGRMDQRVGAVARTNCGVADPREMLDGVFQRMREAGCPAIPVVEAGGSIVGMLTLENVGEFAMVHAAITRGGKHPARA